VILSIASPLQVGLYHDGVLVERFSAQEKVSVSLLPLMMELVDRYPIASMLYTNGPGAYMAIKLTYITLRTIEIVRDIPLFAVNAFAFNGGLPIKAMGNLYFIKEKETIMTKKFQQPPEDQSFCLPNDLSTIQCDRQSEPLYQLPAV
jgi:tRNA A37 threonylcarbamoyladenosine modification protein TsaB